MAEAAPSLGDFFKSKSKKKVKASNLNKETEKPEETKKKPKSAEDDAWEEEKVEASTMKVEVAGKLMREEEKKDEEDSAAPAWGNLKQASNNQINEKRYPTLAKSVGSINVDDGSDNRVNIQTTKNHFAALEGNADSDDDEKKKGPKEIKPAMVSKKKGEFLKAAVTREVDQVKKDAKKKLKKEGDEEQEDDEEEEAEEAVEEEARTEKKKPSEKKEEKKDDKKAKKPVQEEEAGPGDVAEDVKIQVDLKASKDKYNGRKRLPVKDLPREELEEEKENKQKQNTQAPGGKKKKQFIEEDTDKKLSYAPF